MRGSQWCEPHRETTSTLGLLGLGPLGIFQAILHFSTLRHRPPGVYLGPLSWFRRLFQEVGQQSMSAPSALRGMRFAVDGCQLGLVSPVKYGVRNEELRLTEGDLLYVLSNRDNLKN
jgi:hypothetical protein